MNREEALAGIENLYPPDAVDADTEKIGRQLLLSAWALEWRTLPDNILFELCRLNEEKERIEREHYRESLRSQS